jgi:hypothetical protein
VIITIPFFNHLQVIYHACHHVFHLYPEGIDYLVNAGEGGGVGGSSTHSTAALESPSAIKRQFEAKGEVEEPGISGEEAVPWQ